MNNQSLKDNDVKKHKGQTILEHRCKGQTVVYGKTPSKDDANVMVDREFYVDEQKPMFVDNLQEIVNKYMLQLLYVHTMLVLMLEH